MFGLFRRTKPELITLPKTKDEWHLLIRETLVGAYGETYVMRLESLNTMEDIVSIYETAWAMYGMLWINHPEEIRVAKSAEGASLVERAMRGDIPGMGRAA